MVTCSAEIGKARRLWRELNGARRCWREKQRKGDGGGGGRRRPGFIARPRNTETTCISFPMPARSRRWLRPRLEAGRSWPAARATCLHCSSKLPNCHSLYFSNYSQICMETQKSPKIEVVPNSKFYNFALITIPKFCLDLKMEVWNQKGTL